LGVKNGGAEAEADIAASIYWYCADYSLGDETADRPGGDMVGVADKTIMKLRRRIRVETVLALVAAVVVLCCNPLWGSWVQTELAVRRFLARPEAVVDPLGPGGSEDWGRLLGYIHGTFWHRGPFVISEGRQDRLVAAAAKRAQAGNGSILLWHLEDARLASGEFSMVLADDVACHEMLGRPAVPRPVVGSSASSE
jgi:hypothetical protein